jgi:hypothetical protein
MQQNNKNLVEEKFFGSVLLLQEKIYNSFFPIHGQFNFFTKDGNQTGVTVCMLLVWGILGEIQSSVENMLNHCT